MKKICSIGYFEIQSSDRQRDIAFYGNVFGWKFVREENVPIDYYRIETGGIGGGLLKGLPECRCLNGGRMHSLVHCRLRALMRRPNQ